MHTGFLLVLLDLGVAGCQWRILPFTLEILPFIKLNDYAYCCKSATNT